MLSCTESRLKPLEDTFIRVGSDASPRIRRSHSFAGFIPFRLQDLAAQDVKAGVRALSTGKVQGTAPRPCMFAGLPDWSDSDSGDDAAALALPREELGGSTPDAWPDTDDEDEEALGGEPQDAGEVVAAPPPAQQQRGPVAHEPLAEQQRQALAQRQLEPPAQQPREQPVASEEKAPGRAAGGRAQRRSARGARGAAPVLLRLEDYLVGAPSDGPAGEAAPAATPRRAPHGGECRAAPPGGAPQVAGHGRELQRGHQKDFLREGTTTLMIRNLPLRLTTQTLVEELCRGGFAGKFDFCYVPCNFATGQGRGFGFVNLLSPAMAEELHTKWRGSRSFAGEALPTAMNISVAELQGKSANVAALAGPNRRRIRNPVLRPFVA